MKKLVGLTLIMGIMAGMSLLKNEKTIKQKFRRFELQQELKSVYSEYNMLIKNKKHGAKVSQKRLDNLQIKANELKEKIALN